MQRFGTTRSALVTVENFCHRYWKDQRLSGKDFTILYIFFLSLTLSLYVSVCLSIRAAWYMNGTDYVTELLPVVLLLMTMITDDNVVMTMVMIVQDGEGRPTAFASIDCSVGCCSPKSMIFI